MVLLAPPEQRLILVRAVAMVVAMASTVGVARALGATQEAHLQQNLHQI
jgi:hypothetical protein